jgi:hypothetical protein
MERMPVTSSNVVSVGYDEPSRTLEVEYTGGRIYRYFAVPNSVNDGLIAVSRRGESVGKYVDQNVKKVGYEYVQI